jgi:hypothetical protein
MTSYSIFYIQASKQKTLVIAINFFYLIIGIKFHYILLYLIIKVENNLNQKFNFI